MAPELGRRAGDQTRELEDANEFLHSNEQIHDKEMETLEQIATQLITARGTEALYNQILDTALAILRADAASLQMVDQEGERNRKLKLLGQRGLSVQSAKRWEWVDENSRTTCGEALRTGRKVSVADVRKCDFMAGSEDLEAFLAAGIEAAETLPLVSRSGALMGMVTTYWREPHELSENEQRAFDILGRLAADVVERARAEDILSENRQHLALIYDTVRDAIFHLAVESEGRFRFVSVNTAFLRVTGLSSERVIGKTVNEVIPEPSLMLVLEKYQQAITERRTVVWEETSDYPTGRLTGEVSVTPVIDHTGKCTQLVGSVHDITDRKRAETALRDSENRFRNMAKRLGESEAQLKDAQRLAKVGSWERHIETGVSSWSDEIRQILGVANDATLSWTAFIELVHPKDRETVLEVDRKAYSTGTLVETEYRVMRTDGDVRLVRSMVKAIRDDEGAAVRVIGAIQDVTDQVQARQLLYESEERLKMAERLAHLGHWNLDLRYNIATCSEECCRIFGRPLGFTPSYEDFLNAVAPQDRKRVDLVIRKALGEKSGYTIEFQMIRPTGDLRTVITVGELLLDDEGSPAWFLGTFQDITELKLAQQKDFARQQLESIGTLASGIAHDFNNILGSVLAGAELALAEIEAGLDATEELRATRDVAVRGSEIVRQLMLYAGKESAVVGLVDLSQIVREMTELLKISASKHAVLEVNLGENLPAVKADPAQLRQIVMNLVTNASEAIGNRRGVIRVTTRYVKVRRNSSAATTADLAETDHLELEVSDTGRGMSLETQAKVFDPFFTTKSAGRGLGLAMVAGIVRSLRGQIHVTSDLGKGTKFQISLPCEAAPSTDLTSSGAQTGRCSQRPTVLVVEDEDALRHAAAKMLRTSGFEVIEAADGSIAIDALRAAGSKIDIILLDLTIPGPSSREVAAEYVRVKPDAKVILTSAYSEDLVRAIMIIPEIRSFIRKPYHLTDLVKTLQDALS